MQRRLMRQVGAHAMGARPEETHDLPRHTDSRGRFLGDRNPDGELDRRGLTGELASGRRQFTDDLAAGREWCHLVQDRAEHRVERDADVPPNRRMRRRRVPRSNE